VDAMRVIRIGSMGRSISVGGITAMTQCLSEVTSSMHNVEQADWPATARPQMSSAARVSLSRLLGP